MQKEGLSRRKRLYRTDESGSRRRTRAAEEEGAERLERKCVTRTSYINVTQEQASGGREQREGAEGSRAEAEGEAEAEGGAEAEGNRAEAEGRRGDGMSRAEGESGGRSLYGLSGVQRSLAISFPAMKRQRSELCGRGE